ncbi:response regulator receiver modulated serine phosphatase [Stanieria cyanosphaera PCC 7437]|uniref:histidine kinase n=1 Tax=Stanieria cyanosphaera (strain ATCC 29371 / PCC 7437) TaxID=111780 RepID=K9XZV9_STAC7|nr:SpoIIE family protein phosphatase [Stanieria cyanosphaera]AFZ37666.1 response regulator receiver modulated serine phosphatase [Stanieria cyanosphaera PCC 7437]
MTTDSCPPLSLLAHLRHELRTPINAIIGYSEMLLEELETEDTAALSAELQVIRENGVQLLALVNTLLNSSQSENDQLNLSLSVLSQITLQLEIPAQTVINCSGQLLKQADSEFVCDLNKIYTAAENFLKILAELPNFSQPQLLINQTYPLSLSQSKPASNSDSNSVISLTNQSEGKILVVDDNPTNRDLLSRQIKAQGYQVGTAANGQQVLELIQTGEYDLILLDIIMPEMDGYQVLKSLRDSQWRYIPVIMISALDQIDSVVKCIEMGAEDYLAKPFNPVLLKARISACLEKKRLRDQQARYLEQLAQANQEITNLNQRLQAENIRLSAELDITRRLQQMILPKEQELSQLDELDIAGFMEPAEEVGGDYYDVLHHDGKVKIAIGDVTGHGLESGVLSIMVQTAVRTLMENNETDPIKFLETLNRTIYKNVQRMNSDKNLTFCLIDYQAGQLNLSGQHEEIIVVRAGGEIERIDTVDLGFPLGLEETIADFIVSAQIKLNADDVVILYTDGVTEAENTLGVQYGLERLCNVVKQNWYKSANTIKQLVIEDLRLYIGGQKVYDDITLVVLKQK